MHKLLQIALDHMNAKGIEHNNSMINFASYCPFGDLSAATLLHREALRVCAEAERSNLDGEKEHLVDTVVYAVLMWDYLTSRQGE